MIWERAGWGERVVECGISGEEVREDKVWLEKKFSEEEHSSGGSSSRGDLF